jgi:hypothetical protein
MVVCHEDAEEGAVGVLDPSASISHTTRVVSTLSRPATLCYERSNVTVIYTAKYTEYWKQNSKRFKAGDFIAELPQHIPQKQKHLGGPSDCPVLWAVFRQDEGEGEKSSKYEK